MKVTIENIKSFEHKNRTELPWDYIGFLLSLNRFELGNNMELPEEYKNIMLGLNRVEASFYENCNVMSKTWDLFYSYEGIYRVWREERYQRGYTLQEITEFIPFFSKENLSFDDCINENKGLPFVFNRDKYRSAEMIDDEAAEFLSKLRPCSLNGLAISAIHLEGTKLLPIAYTFFEGGMIGSYNWNNGKQRSATLLLLNVDQNTRNFGAVFQWRDRGEIHLSDRELPVNDFTISPVASSFLRLLRNIYLTTQNYKIQSMNIRKRENRGTERTEGVIMEKYIPEKISSAYDIIRQVS